MMTVAGTGLSRERDLAHGLAGGEVLGDESDDDAADRARDHCPPHVGAHPHQAGDDVEGHDDEEHRGAHGADAKRGLRGLRRDLAHDEDADDRAQQSSGREPERKEHQGLPRPQALDHAERHRGSHRDGGDHRAAVGLEEIRAHAGDVAHVVAHVVRDDPGIPGVVLRDPGLDLAHEVRAHVGALGVDPPADAREEGDARRAHSESVDVVSGVRVSAEEQVEYAQAQQAERGDREAHDRAAEEGHGQRIRGAVRVGGGRRAHVGAGGGVHADVAGAGRAQRADQERDRSARAQARGEEEQHEEDETEPCEHGVLAPHEHHGAEADLLRDLGDLRLALGKVLDALVDVPRGAQTDEAENNRPDVRAHEFLPSLSIEGRGRSSTRGIAQPSDGRRAFSPPQNRRNIVESLGLDNLPPRGAVSRRQDTRSRAGTGK